MTDEIFYECLACKKPRTSSSHDCQGPEGLPLRDPITRALPQWIKDMDSYGIKSQTPWVLGLINALTIAWEFLEESRKAEESLRIATGITAEKTAAKTMRQIEELWKEC